MGVGEGMTQLLGKNILITGSSRGFGKMLAYKLWGNGANLILVARSMDHLIKIKEELKPVVRGQILSIYSQDLSDLESIPLFIEKIQCSHSIDVLINNAAIQGPIGSSWEVDWLEWNNAINMDLLAPVILTRACLPAMIQSNSGKIINLSGGGATSSRPQFSAYATAKTGLVRFTEILADELREHSIDVNCVSPGIMNTDMLKSIVEAGPEKSGENEYRSACDKLEEEINSEQALDLCVFLSSEASRGISGKLISAVWDAWEKLPEHLQELNSSDIYTLRRIVPEDRGKEWK